MKRQSSKSSSRISNKKTRLTSDSKSNVFFEDNASPNVKVKFVFDKDAPFYEHKFNKE